jgi:hypothetical protein
MNRKIIESFIKIYIKRKPSKIIFATEKKLRNLTSISCDVILDLEFKGIKSTWYVDKEKR